MEEKELENSSYVYFFTILSAVRFPVERLLKDSPDLSSVMNGLEITYLSKGRGNIGHLITIFTLFYEKNPLRNRISVRFESPWISVVVVMVVTNII